MNASEFRGQCLSDSRLRQLWLDLVDATLEHAAVRARTAFARHGGKTPDEGDLSLLPFLSTRYEAARESLVAEAAKRGYQTEQQLTADDILALSV